MHLISGWRSPPGHETRFEARCGRVDTDLVEVADGELWCVACREIEADEDTAPGKRKNRE